MEGEMDRLRWLEDFNDKEVEWLLIDPETNRYKFCRAETQEEALKQALEWGIHPRRTDNIKPLHGRPRGGCMKEEKFQELLGH